MTQPGTASQSSLVGSIIDNKVRLEAILGQGGMGAVYRGRHLLLERTVAVKVLRPEILTVEGSLERFFREARTAAATEHPNIVTVYDFGKLPDGGAYLILEFVEGKGLRHILLEQGTLPPSLALPILREVCAAVEFAHRRNIIHRDLKPDNIMLKRRDDGSATVKVLDFGLAKTVEEAESSSSITRTGELVGTPAYMSPEHCSGEDLDPRSDLYSLAIIAYEMLAGQPPFRGRVAAILTAQIQKPPTPLRDLNPNVPPVLEEAVMAALAKKPSDRPESVAEWWDRLEAAYAAAYGTKPSPAIPLSLPTPTPFKAPTGDITPALEASPAQKANLQVSSLQPTPATQDTGVGTFAIGNPLGTDGQASSPVSASHPSQAPATPTPRPGTGTLAIGAASTPAPDMVTVQTVATAKAPEPRSKSVQRLGIVGGISAALVIGGLAATSWLRPAAPVTSPVEKPAPVPPPVTAEPPLAITPAVSPSEETTPTTPLSPTPTPASPPTETTPAVSPTAVPPTRRPTPAEKARDEAVRVPRSTPDESRNLPGPVARPTQPPAETPAPPPSRPPEEATRTEPVPTPRPQPGSGTTRAPRAEQRQAEKREEKREKRRFWEIWKIGRDKDDKDKDKRRPRD